MGKIWFKDGLVDEDQANIHVISHSLHYGGAVFEGIRSYETGDGKVGIFRLDDHINRLLYSCKAIGFKINDSLYSKENLEKAIISVVRDNKLKDSYVRPIFFFDKGQMSLYPQDNVPYFAAAAWPWTYLKKEGVKAKISSYKRIHSDSSVIDAKISGQYFNSILATNEAVSSGADEAILLDHNGNIAEGPGENIFLVKNGEMFTPSKGSILPGITRNTVIDISKELGIKLTEETIKKDDLFLADEIFFTGTAVQICPVLEVDRQEISKGRPGLITEAIAAEYDAIVRGERPEHKNWLTYI